jgi:hypothetical protein
VPKVVLVVAVLPFLFVLCWCSGAAEAVQRWAEAKDKLQSNGLLVTVVDDVVFDVVGKEINVG